MKPGAAISSAWETAGSWAAADATLVIALHPSSESTCCDAKILEDGRSSVSEGAMPLASAHSF
ncbi:MAG: hypothetical protein DUD39_14665 [Coriobacteriaceae bacterium]|nr:MAG: hypothetical protein DUD39_14665 [Coriobacteriaceae bacterium]